MDGIEELRGVVVLAATNRPDLLDTALLRAGRFEVRLDLPEPDRNARKTIFEVHLRGKPMDDDVDVDKLADMTEGFVGADIESVCRRASMEAIRTSVEEGVGDEVRVLRPTSAANFDHAIEAVKALRATTEAPKAAKPSEASNSA